MAKKTKKQNKKAPANKLPENMLPQNILPVGARVEENKNIYISQAVYKEIHKFTKNKTTNESGGMLVGTVIEEFGKSNIIISGFVEAKFCEATPTTLKFTHETWKFVHKEIEKKHAGKKIVGWIHTHPDFGIFLSEYDKFIHQNFFSEAHQVAYVVDPIQNIEGFYFWINDNLEKCKGFYIYDKTGTEITVNIESDMSSVGNKTGGPLFSIKNIVIAILSIAVVLLVFSNISTNNKLERIEKQQQALIDSAYQAHMTMQQLIWQQAAELQALSEVLTEVGIIADPNSTDNQDDGTSTDTGADEVGDAGQDGFENGESPTGETVTPDEGTLETTNSSSEEGDSVDE